MKFYYTPEAIQDLDRLKAFIEEKNPQAANRIALKLLKGINQLKRFPFLGRKVEKAPNPEIVRDLVLGKYVVRYLVLESSLHILRIWHHKENWANQ